MKSLCQAPPKEIKERIDRKILYMLYDVYLFAMLLSINYFFSLFIYNKYDLTPNIALAICTLPAILVQLYKIFDPKNN
jgi:hypothetical protein